MFVLLLVFVVLLSSVTCNVSKEQVERFHELILKRKMKPIRRYMRDIENVVELMEKVNVRNGMNALHLGIDMKYDKLINRIFKKENISMDLGIKTTKGLPALHLACKTGYGVGIMALMENGADYNIAIDGYYPVHYLTRYAGKDKDASMALMFLFHRIMMELRMDEYVVSYDPDAPEEKPKKKATPEEVFAKYPHSAMINATTVEEGKSVLMLATEFASHEFVASLLSYHPNLNHQDVDGNTVLHIAARDGKEFASVLGFLRAGVHDDIWNKDGKTAKELAKENEHYLPQDILLFDEYKKGKHLNAIQPGSAEFNSLLTEYEQFLAENKDNMDFSEFKDTTTSNTEKSMGKTPDFTASSIEEAFSPESVAHMEL